MLFQTCIEADMAQIEALADIFTIIVCIKQWFNGCCESMTTLSSISHYKVTKYI